MSVVPVEELVAGDVVVLAGVEVKVLARFDGRVLLGRVRRRDGWMFHGRVFPVRAGARVRRVRWECPLSARQLAVLGVLASGEVASVKGVAARLGVTEKTVHNHIGAAARVLGTSGTVQTLVVAVRQGWVLVPGPVAVDAA